MAKIKNRAVTLFTSGIQVGGTGTTVSRIVCGSSTASVLQMTASGPTVAGSMVATGVPVGAKVFLQPLSSCMGVVVTNAIAASANAITASFQNAAMAATGGACDMTFQWLAVY